MALPGGAVGRSKREKRLKPGTRITDPGRIARNEARWKTNRGKRDMELAERLSRAGKPLPQDLKDRADFAKRQQEKTKLSEINVFREKHGITPTTKLSTEGMEARNVEMQRRAEEEEAQKAAEPFLQTDSTVAPETTQGVSTEDTRGLFQPEFPIGSEEYIQRKEELEEAGMGLGDPIDMMAMHPMGLPVKGLQIGERIAIKYGISIPLAKIIGKAPSTKLGDRAVSLAAAGYSKTDAAFVKGLKGSIKLKKGDWIGNMVKHDIVKLKTSEYLKPGWDAIKTNTKSAKLVDGWVGKVAVAAGLSMFAISILKDAISSIIMGKFIGLEEGPQTLGFAFQRAREMENLTLMEEINVLHRETLTPEVWDNVPWKSSFEGIDSFVNNSRKYLDTNEQYVEWLKGGAETSQTKYWEDVYAKQEERDKKWEERNK